MTTYNCQMCEDGVICRICGAIDGLNIPLSQQQRSAIKVAASLQNKAIVLEAVAGSGKTYTLKALIRVLKLLYPTSSILYLVFNKKNQEEMQAQIGPDLATVKTFHSAGFTSFSRACKGKRLTMDSNKLKGCLQAANVPQMIFSVVRDLVSHAKSRAIGITCPADDRSAYREIIEHFGLETELLDAATDLSLEELTELSISYAIDVLKETVKISYKDLILDFDDQLYLPCLDKLCLSADYAKFDFVLVDECQDTSTIRRLLATKLLKSSGHLIAVGDRYQAIYGFAGADNDSIEQIEKQFSAVTMPLTVSFRCPQSVVNHARKYVPHIQAADTAPIGEVKSAGLTAILADWELLPSDAMISRYTKHLVSTAYKLLKKGIACQILGKDLASGLLKLVNKWKKVKDLTDLSDKLADFRDKQTAKLISAGKDQAADNLRDQVECLLFLIDNMPATADLDTLRNQINGMFCDDKGERKPILTLMTCHKSKGLEFSRVFWINPGPSTWAKKDWQVQQETNLMYVTTTRAKETLVLVQA